MSFDDKALPPSEHVRKTVTRAAPTNQPVIIQQPQQEPQPPRNRRKLLYASIITLLLVASSIAVWAAFNLNATVTAPVGQTNARIIHIELNDTSTATNMTLTCTGLPGNAPTCNTVGVINPGDNFTLKVTVENNGPVKIPTVTGSAFAVLTYTDAVTTTVTHTNSLSTTTTSTTSLATSATWTFHYSLSVTSAAVAGGTLTLTATVNG